MVSRGYRWRSCSSRGAAKDRAKLRLTEQKALQRHGPIENDVWTASEVFERLEGQVLGLVNIAGRACVTVLRQREIADPLQQ